MLGKYMLWFAVVVGLAAFAVAVSYARRPTDRKLTLMRPLSLAGIFAALCSLTAGWAAVSSTTGCDGRPATDPVPDMRSNTRVKRRFGTGAPRGSALLSG